MESRHCLAIRRIFGTPPFEGRLQFADGTERYVYGHDRAQVIARAQEAIQQYREIAEVFSGVEILTLDEFGEIIREPEQHSMRVVS